MARPLKDRVDYFPHFVNHGKTIPILQGKYGNDGYSFLFKIFELLCKSEGHYFNCNDSVDLEFLLAYTLVSEDIAFNILDLLAKLETIDQFLWNYRIIWSENLIENLTPLYSRRKQKPPTKRDIVIKLSLPRELLHTETQPGNENGTKVHTIIDKGKESKVKESVPGSSEPAPPPAKKSRRKPQTAVTEAFQPDEKTIAWAKEKGYLQNLTAYRDAFVRRCLAKGYVYADHQQAFKNSIIDDWGKLRENSFAWGKPEIVTTPKTDMCPNHPDREGRFPVDGQKYCLECMKAHDEKIIADMASQPNRAKEVLENIGKIAASKALL